MGEPESRTHDEDSQPVYPFERRLVSPYAPVSASYRVVSTDRDAEELANFLTGPFREMPVVVLSSAKDGPRFKPEDVATRLGAGADVYLLASTGVAFEYERHMPFECSVYGGAARIYPPGNAWTNDPGKSALFFAYTDAEARAKLDRIADDIDRMVPLSYQQPRKPVLEATPEPSRPDPVDGRVSAFVDPSTALVTLDGGAVARVELPVCGEHFDASRLLPPGMAVSGWVEDGLLEIRGRNTPADVADYAAVGTVQLALVTSEKTVMLFPGLEVRYRSGAEAGTLIAVLVELAGRVDGKSWRLSAVADLSEAEPALPFVEGGAPWTTTDPVEEPEQAPAQPEAVAEAAGPAREAPGVPMPAEAGGEAPRAGRPDVLGLFDAARAVLEILLEYGDRLRTDNAHLTDTVETLNEELDSLHAKPSTGPVPAVSPQAQEIARLNGRIAMMQRDKLEIVEDLARAIRDADQLATENSELTRVNERLREEVRTERERANRARQEGQRAAGETPAEDATGPLFCDPAAQFRHEVYLEWAQRIPAASKAELPLADYNLAPGFLESVDELQGVSRAKIVSVAVEVLTGLADRQPGRDMHRLRAGNAGSPYIEDPVLGTAWRASLQVKTASARRMHFWRGTDGRVVFATVGVHDETDI